MNGHEHERYETIPFAFVFSVLAALIKVRRSQFVFTELVLASSIEPRCLDGR